MTTKPFGSRSGFHQHDTAGVLAAPPLLFGAALVVALLTHVIHPMPIAPGSPGVVRVVGAALIAIGVAISVAVMRAFAQVGTEVSPYRPTTHLVCEGPFRYSRNPDYIGQTLIYTGIALVANAGWPLLLLPVVLIAVDRGVIAREEHYLESKYHERYTDYKTRVRRWL